MTDKRPWDFGVWECKACGKEMPGERAEPPLDHVHNCDEAHGDSLVFDEDN
jgi:ribosomal protein L37AE/L43A